MPKLHNLQSLKPIRKYLRNNGTSAEATLWLSLMNKQVGGLKFRRQHSVGNYILDFYCLTIKLAIEIDGEPHGEFANIERDKKRDLYLKKLVITVFRYENRWIFEYPDVIKQEIIEFAEKVWLRK